MNFRDWLIVVGIVIILGILADGYRRMRQAKMDSLKMSRNMGAGIENTPIDDDYNPELPSGGARIVAPGVDTDDSAVAGADESRSDPSITATDEEPLDDVTNSDAPLTADRSDKHDAGLDESISVSAGKIAEESQTEVPSKQSGNSDTVSDADQNDREVIIINVDAKQNQIFQGTDIKKLLEACGMQHGDMSIFHRHEEDDLLSPIQFSVANAVEPGYFDPDQMEQLSTPGVSFFLSLPGPKDYMKAFDYMLETAQCFASNLGGELSDERRSVLTKQTIEHFRHRVREFERKQLSRSKA